MSALHALALAILQGVAELFPISSLGHAVIVPPLLGWSTIDQHSSEFLPFIVVLHVGTAVALLLYFWRDWAAIASGILGGRGSPKSADAWNALGLIVVATLPAVAIGFLFEKLVRGLFASPLIAALFLIVNGFLLLLGAGARRAGGGHLAMRRVYSRHLALRRGDGRRPRQRAAPYRGGAFLVPDRDPDHRRRRGARSAEADRAARPRPQRSGDRRRRCRRHHRLSQHRVPDALFPAPRFRQRAGAVRGLLLGRRRRSPDR